LHVAEADEYGNLRHLGPAFCDQLLAKAAGRVIATTERLVANDTVRAEPYLTTVPGYLVDAVVHVPFGAHPCSAYGVYPHDEAALRDYLGAAQDAAGFGGWLRRFVHDPPDREHYLRAMGGRQRLAGLDDQVS
jgi:glutaconate CoA-transferase, subunit A